MSNKLKICRLGIKMNKQNQFSMEQQKPLPDSNLECTDHLIHSAME